MAVAVDGRHARYGNGMMYDTQPSPPKALGRAAKGVEMQLAPRDRHQRPLPPEDTTPAWHGASTVTPNGAVRVFGSTEVVHNH